MRLTDRGSILQGNGTLDVKCFLGEMYLSRLALNPSCDDDDDAEDPDEHDESSDSSGEEHGL